MNVFSAANWLKTLVLVGIACGTSDAFAGGNVPSSEQLKFFETKVRPLLASRCHKCHGEEKQRGDLRLDSVERVLTGGESGPAVSPGNPDESLLIDAVRWDSLEMPPDGRLPESEIAILTQWVRMGAPWPASELPQPAPIRHERSEKLTDADRRFWSFQPVRRVPVPEVADDAWSRNPIDKFVLAKLQQEGLTAAGEAKREQLIRRLYFDLIGLPPSAEEIQHFVADRSPQAYERLVDRLLNSPQYGERWARHWLDLVRYAESDGYKQDAYRPDAWRYRDYVIRSFNEDKPYDQFVREQLAGDELAPHDPESYIATSLLRHGIYEYNQRDVRTQWETIVNDVTDLTADVFLGMGLACARCHDHKSDPLLQEDYFRMRAFFAPMVWREDVLLASPDKAQEYEQALARWEEATAEIRHQIAELEAPHRQRAAAAAIAKFPPDIRPMMQKPPAQREPLEQQLAQLAFRQVEGEYQKLDFDKKLQGEQKEQYERLQQQLAEFDHLKPDPVPAAFTVTDLGPEAPVTIIPGDRKQQEIAPGFLSVLDPRPAVIEPLDAVSQSTGRRAALARWITDPANPLSTRVIVNRVWQYHFGRGIVETASDFGRLGEAPTHPELLEWLTSYFLENGWRLKPLHRLIVTSATYRQSAEHPESEVARQKDPEARWLWHHVTRRLDAEQIRDAMLAATGELDLTAGGPSAEWSSPRRSVYLKILRNDCDPLLDVFDAPDGFSSVAQRNTTTTPTQSLLMINGNWTLERAAALADRVKELSEEQRLTEAFQRAWGRVPTADQRLAAERFLQQHAAGAESDEALVDLCHVLLNANQFLYLD